MVLTNGITVFNGTYEQDIIEAGDGINFISGDASWGILDLIKNEDDRTKEKIYNKYKTDSSDIDDDIKGGNGINIIHAGPNNDLIKGGAGINLIQFKVGDGDDIIENSAGTDYIYFCDCSLDETKTVRKGDDLVIEYGRMKEGSDLDVDYNGSITVKDYFKNGNNASLKGIGFSSGPNSAINLTEIENVLNSDITIQTLGSAITNTFKNSAAASDLISFQNKDEDKYTIEMPAPGSVSGTNGNDNIKGSAGSDIINGGGGDDIITGGPGNDKLYGGSGTNTFVFNEGDGKDTVYYQKGTDILDLTNVQNLNGESIASYKEKNDLIIKYGDGDEIRLADYFRNKGRSDIRLKIKETSTDGSTTEVVKNIKDFALVETDFSAQTKGRTIVGSIINDKITGTTKNDVIRGGEGNDIIFGGDGNDRLYGDNGNDTIYGGAGNDIIYGGNGNDEIYGGAGDDKLYGTNGSNTFHFEKGDGKDIVYTGKGSDTLNFHKINFSDLTYSLGKSNSLTINYGNGDSVDIAAYFSKKGKVSTKKIITEDNEKTLDEITNDKDFKVLIDGILNKRNTLRGTYKNDILTGGNLNDTIYGNDGDDIIFGGGGNDVLRGGNGNDIIYGGTGDDKLYGDKGINTFVFSKGDGKDTVYSGKGQDTIKFEGIGEFDPKTMYFSAKGNNLIINYNEGDSITVLNYLANPAKSSVQHIQFEGKEPVLISELIKEHPFEFYGINGKRNGIRGTNTTDIIKGGNLNDTITALGGDDVISAGDGADLVRGGNGNDIIFGEGGNDRLYGDNGDDTIYGGAGNDIIYGGNGNDIIFGGTGDDRLYGDSGNNTFYFREGDGKDTIYMNAKGSDTIVFDAGLKDTLTFDRKGNNLVINYGTKGDSVTIINCINSKNPSIKNIVFSDYNDPKGNFGKTEGILLSDIIVKKAGAKFQLSSGKYVNGEYYKGNAYNNLIISTGTYSEIDAGAGNDTVYLQSRNVTAFGGAGNDKYIVSSLNNNTNIIDTEGQNTVKILDKKTNVKVLFDVKVSNGEVVNSPDDNDSLLILNNAAFNRIKSTGKLNTAVGIKIDDFSSTDGISGSTPVQKIETNNGYLDMNTLNSIRQEVAGWLANTGYTSAMDVLDGGNKADIKSLLAIYQTTDTKWM